MAPPEPKDQFEPMKLKLVVDHRKNKVLFAEAGKDFVDFLFGLQQIPLGCIIALLKENDAACSGSLDKLYQSIVNLDPTHFQSGTDKDALLSPKVFSAPNMHTPLANYFVIEESQHRASPNVAPPAFISYGQVHTHCPDSSPSKSKQMGWVKDGGMFIVMDDLVIQPLSYISTISLLNNFHVKDISSLEEKTVNIGIQEGLKILKAMFQSDTVLTDVFIKKPRLADYRDSSLTKGDSASYFRFGEGGE